MAEDTAVKIPYTPSETKRFEVSNDPFSRERIAAVHAAYKVLKKEVPFFAGITVFGSLSKGKTLDEGSADKTDMDFVIFLDRSDYERTIEEFAKRDDFIPTPMIGASKERQLRDGAMDYVRKRAVGIIRVNVSHPVKLEERIRAGNAYFIDLDDENLDSIYNRVDFHDEGKRVTRGLGPESELWLAYATPFFLDVGGGLKKYRQAFIRRLQQEPPERAEYLWSIVLKAMKYWERNNVIPDRLTHSFPATFEEARKYYLDKQN